MRAHAQKQIRPQPAALPHRSRLTQRTIGNEDVRALPPANARDRKVSPGISAATRFAHDFSRIPLHSNAPVSLQAKLTVNTPGDIYEQEADRVAEHVMSPPKPQAQHPCPCGGGCPACQNKQAPHAHLQTRIAPSHGPKEVEAPPIVKEVLRSSGQSLDLSTRAFMEPRFGHDFSHVRVHTNAQAAESARAVNALAYTVGRDVVFAAGQYRPGTTAGKRLLAHELTHTLQQARGFQTGSVINQPPGRYEREAGPVALAITHDESFPVYGQAGVGGMRQLMRQQAENPTAPGPGADSNVKEPEDKISKTFNYEAISSDLRALKNLNISGSIVSTSSDAKKLSEGIGKLRSVIERMGTFSISKQGAQNINSKVSELSDKLNLDVAMRLGIGERQNSLASFSAVSFTGAESVSLLPLLEAIGAVLVAIVEAPVVVVLAVIAFIVLIIWAIYEFIKEMVEEADRALCTLLFEQCVTRRRVITRCDSCLLECITNGGNWPTHKCPIPAI